MKKTVLLFMAVLMMCSTVPSLAQQTQEEQQQKNECLLNSKHCANEVDSIQKRIKKLQSEIKKGKKVYSPDELKKLEEKLK